MLDNKSQIKTRFAPSPTGYMHLGNFRTALFTYLFAKQNKGKFVVRIEDTDKAREVEGAEEVIFRALKWAGFSHDEGPDIGGPNGPYRQSERLDIYKQHIEELIKKNKAYYCFCTSERLDQMRKEQQAAGKAPGYDGYCLNLSKEEVEAKIKAGEKHVIRQRVDKTGTTKFKDLVRGEIEIQNAVLDDSVLMKSDGYPTYNFANVIDDHLMEITHVIRGEEYINSTPKYIQLYEAFGWEVPEHAHLSLILNKDKSKLSKRQGDVALEDYIEKGYLREAILNFIALLGWNPGTDQELFTLEELVKEFSLEKVNKAGAIFDIEKLDWMNGHYIRQKTIDEFTELCLPYLEKEYGESLKNYQEEYIKAVVGLEQERMKKLSDVVANTKYFFVEPEYEAKILVWKKSDNTESKSRLEFVKKYLAEFPDENWTRNALEEKMIEEIKRQGFGNGDTLWPMRAALSGAEKSPSPFELAEVLGKKKTLERLQVAIEKL